MVIYEVILKKDHNSSIKLSLKRFPTINDAKRWIDTHKGRYYGELVVRKINNPNNDVEG